MKIGLSKILLNSTLCSGAFIDMFIKTKKYLSKSVTVTNQTHINRVKQPNLKHTCCLPVEISKFYLNFIHRQDLR